MKLNFAKMNPTQNMTIIVTDPVPRREQVRIAGQLMAYGSVGAEQVGFMEETSLPGARARLQMMGGEFCGNATISLAALLAHEDGLADGASAIYPLEISGAEGIVRCGIRRCGSSYLGTVRMPLPERIREMDFGENHIYPLVEFPGIAHAIVPEDAMTPAEAEACIASWCDMCGADAFGILLVNSGMSAIRPLVYVKETRSSVWEHGCGSGSAAIGAYAALQGHGRLDLSQPGGVIQVHARIENEHLSSIEITGRVRIAAIGTAWIDD